MTITEIKDMLFDLDQDIREYQREYGGFIVLDPSTEASRLCDIRNRLQVTLNEMRDAQRHN